MSARLLLTRPDPVFSCADSSTKLGAFTGLEEQTDSQLEGTRKMKDGDVCRKEERHVRANM